MIFLATDFGLAGPYGGQVKARIARDAAGIKTIDLFADLPKFQPRLAAYLLAAYAGIMEEGDVMLAVVDPGVGSERLPLMIEVDGRWYVGPDNGLFELIRRRAVQARSFKITWLPEVVSPSFHGRDLFAPVAARLARGDRVPGDKVDLEPHADWPDDLSAIVYVDHYGNAMSGLRAGILAPDTELEIGGIRVGRARIFSDLPAGAACWYENANGLAEIAVNGGSAAETLALRPGSEVIVHPST